MQPRRSIRGHCHGRGADSASSRMMRMARVVHVRITDELTATALLTKPLPGVRKTKRA
jgi:hypothetical protein